MSEHKLMTNLKSAIENTKSNIVYNVNIELLKLYIYIGEQIQKDIEEHKGKSDYKKHTISAISAELTNEYGKGYSRRNLRAMLIFYIKYKKWESVTPTLSWNHYIELLSLKNDNERRFYEIECAKQRWSMRELRRQIKTGYYQRVLLGAKDQIPEKMGKLTSCGKEINEPRDVLVDPIVLNFFKAKSNLKERDIENGIIAHMKEFLLEIGPGFKFIDNQYQINIANKKYFIDLVFYNEILKCYVLIELKATPFQKNVTGQINTYLNYFKNNVNNLNDNDPVGIVMCTEFDHVQVEYALGNINNQIFVTKYITHLPNKEKLEIELRKLISENFSKTKTS